MGFEALYWMPFIRGLRIDPNRLVAITRGGAGVWYGAARAVELYDMRSPESIRVENKRQVFKTGMLKQIELSPFDRAILRDVAETLNLKRYRVLHPKWMFAVLEPFLRGDSGINALNRHFVFDRLPAPPLPEGVELPKAFIAVRFYLRHTFPHHPETLKLAKGVIENIASRIPVVLLNSTFHTDDHIDLTFEGKNILKISELIQPNLESNLLAQSAVLARAQGFVGTYGGLAQLALRFGVSSATFYTEWSGTALAHKQLADALAVSMGLGFDVFKVADVSMIQAVLPKS